MSTLRRPRSNRVPLASACLVLALALTGCGASLDAQTYQERSTSDSTNTAVGTIALRDVSVLPPRGDDRTLEEGRDATVTLVMTNADDEPDALLEVTSPDAESVELLLDDEQTDEIVVEPFGSTEDRVGLRMVGLDEDLFEGEYTVLTFRFERAGSLEVPVPVQISGRTDRPVYTGEPGGEGEPALQAPAGGHHGEEEHAEEEAGAEEEQAEEGAH